MSKPVETDWESMKSELEVVKEQVLNNRQKFHFVVRRRLEDFGGAADFADEDAVAQAQFPPYEDKSFNIHVNQLNKSTQIESKCQIGGCQTEVVNVRNVSTQYIPRELKSESDLHLIVHSKSMIDFIHSVEPRMHNALEQAEIVNVFAEDKNQK